MKKCKTSILFSLLAVLAYGTYAVNDNDGNNANAGGQGKFTSNSNILNGQTNNSQSQQVPARDTLDFAKENFVSTQSLNTKLDYSKVQGICVYNYNYPDFDLFFNDVKYYYNLSTGGKICLKTNHDGSLAIADPSGNPFSTSELDPGLFECDSQLHFCKAVVHPEEKLYTPNGQPNSNISLANMKYDRFSGTYQAFNDADARGFSQYLSINFPAGFAGHSECAYFVSSYDLVEGTDMYIANITIAKCGT